MLLRSLSKHVKDQNWFAVFLDFFIVVVGILLAFQITNWNEVRSEQERSENYLLRIRSDLETDMQELNNRQKFWNQISKESKTAITFAEKGEVADVPDWGVLRAFLHASHAWTFRFTDATYSELLSAGELDLMPSEELREGLSDYYLNIAPRRDTEAYGVYPDYREMLRGRMLSDIMHYYWQSCFEQGVVQGFGIQIFLDCPPPNDTANIEEALENLATDQKMIDALRYWGATQPLLLELSAFDIARAQSLIDKIDGKK